MSKAPDTTMTVADVVQVLKTTIAEDLDVNLSADQIDESVPLLDGGLELDSVVIVELIGAIESRLGFEFEDSDLRTRSFQSLRTLAEVILARLANTK